MKNDEYQIMYDMEQTYFWFVGKQFLIKTVFQKFGIDLLNRGKILDIGCGTGIILKVLNKFGKACGIEYSNDAIQFLKQRGLDFIVRADANQDLPFMSSIFSAITCLDVLEHLDNDSNLLWEIYRVCQPGGYMIITVPAFDMFWSVHDIALHHRRRYTRSKLLKSIKGMDCKIVKMSYYNTILSFPILAVRKIKSVLFQKTRIQSDFSIPIPPVINRVLSLLFIIEINFLRLINLPFGVSFLIVLKKNCAEDICSGRYD